MDDLIWFLSISVFLALLGFVFVGLGLAVWKKRKMGLIIHSHCDKVKEENKQAYCRLFGIGLCLIGMGFVLSGLWAAFSQSLLVLLPMGAGLAGGTALLAAAEIRYNH